MFLEISQNSQENTCPRPSFLMKLQQVDCFYNRLDLYRHLYCYRKYYVCGSEAYLKPCQISTMILFVKIVNGWKLLTVLAKKLQALRHASLLKRDFNTVGVKLNFFFFKITNSDNLFEDFSAMPLTHSKSLITCNSHNNKLISKCIQ